MNKIHLSNHIKLEILNTCGLPTLHSYNLEGKTLLSSLGYDDQQQCRQLEEKLRFIAADHNTGRSVPAGTISKEFTVSQCIQLIMA